MGEFFDSIKGELDALGEDGLDADYGYPSHLPMHMRRGGRQIGVVFGTDYSSDTPTTLAVQRAINTAGYTPALAEDGAFGPLTAAGIRWMQEQKGLSPITGVVDDALLAALSIPAPRLPPVVKISTVIAALKQAAAEKGYTLSDQLLSLMIGQLRGAEGAYPGVHSSLGGTNNYGASQAVQSLATSKSGQQGWGAFAHKDSDPNKGAYIGWYWIAPSPLEGARHWFQDNWWGPALANGNPTDASTYAAILYKGGYYGGMHAGDTAHDPTSEAGAQNVADYAAAISRGMPSAAELATPPDDPSTITVDPGQFAPLDARAITEALYDTAMSGGIGSAWKWLLPATWEELNANNGVVWFGPPPPSTPAASGATSPIAMITNLPQTLASLPSKLKALPQTLVAGAKANPRKAIGIGAAVVAFLSALFLMFHKSKAPPQLPAPAPSKEVTP